MEVNDNQEGDTTITTPPEVVHDGSRADVSCDTLYLDIYIYK